MQADLSVPEAIARLAVRLTAELPTRPGLADLVREALNQAAASAHPDAPALADALASLFPPTTATADPPPPAPPDDDLADRLRADTLPAPLREPFAALADVPADMDPAPALTTALRALAGGAGEAGTLDAALSLLREWAGRRGLEVMPRRWTFADPLTAGDLPEDESAGVSPVFRSREPKGLVYRVREFGLIRGGEALRPCAVSVSAGPAPAGLAELEERLNGPTGDTWDEARLRLREWRQAGLTDTLELAAERFYVDFWGELGDPLRRDDPERAAAAGECLLAVMEGAFGLRAFRPKTLLDKGEGWAKRVSRNPVVTGVVRAVHRPGLADSAGELRIPALVDVD